MMPHWYDEHPRWWSVEHDTMEVLELAAVDTRLVFQNCKEKKV